MKEIVNECCGCSVPPYPCDVTCPLRSVTHYYCDCCGDDIDLEAVFEVDGEDLCLECLKRRFKKEV
jgi:hypothetical protein